MFAVIYRVYVKPGREADYQAAWKQVACYFMQQRGAIGSCLHRSHEGYWVAYSRWPDKATRDNSWPGDNAPSEEFPEDIRAAIKTLQDCGDPDRKLPEICMDVDTDFLSGHLTVQEIMKTDSKQLKMGHAIFMNYFLDLYQDLHIEPDTKSYLTKIIQGTEQALKTHEDLHAILVYLQDKAIGFSTFGPLENPHTILIRTLPINPAYKNIELDIRNTITSHVRRKFPKSKEIAIMVRKTNTHHQELCLRAGFLQDPDIFDRSSYIRNTYDSDRYWAFSLKT